MHELHNLAKAVNWDGIFEVLKDKPDIVNIRPDTRDFGLIHFAVFNLRHDQAERLLTEFKADIHLKTKEGKNCLALIEESLTKQPLDLPALTKRKNQELHRFVKELDHGIKDPVPPKVALARSGHSPVTATSMGTGVVGRGVSSPTKTSYPADGGARKIGGWRLEVINVPGEVINLGGEYIELNLHINSRPVYRQNGSRHFLYYLDDEKWGWVIHSALDDECQMPLAFLGPQSSTLRVHPCNKPHGVYWALQRRVAIAGKTYQTSRDMTVQRCY
jgi:hypothetical protein